MIKCNSCGGTTVAISEGVVRCEYCGKIYSVSDKGLDSPNLEELYNQASSMLNEKNIERIGKALEIFEMLDSYKDSTILAEECRRRIQDGKVEEENLRLEAIRQDQIKRMEEEKQAHEKEKKAKIYKVILISVIAIVFILILVSSISNSIRRQTELKNKYQVGIDFYERGAYGECIKSLADISDYKESKTYIDQSEENLYQQASQQFADGEYEKAKNLLTIISEDSDKCVDVEILLKEIDAAIISEMNLNNYEKAKEYYEEEKFIEAQRLFVELGKYEESKDYLTMIAERFYDQANELLEKGEYIQCGELLQLIDTPEEWNEYKKATEIYQSISDTYLTEVKETAKDICRSEGVSAMGEYIDSSICVFLSSEDASAIKKECEINKVSLENMDVLMESHDSDIKCGTSIEDTIGNTYTYSLIGFPGHKDSYLVYDAGGKYKYFQATVCVMKPYRPMEDTKNGYIRIYGDDKLLWSDENITTLNRPYNINVDIENVMNLKITMKGGNLNLFSMLGNPTLSE